MKKYIIITADTNDADYVTQKSLITDETILKLQPIIQCLQDRHKLYQQTGNWEYRHNWETDECDSGHNPELLYVKTGLLTQEQVDYFNEFIPSSEYGIHTIQSIEIINVTEEIKLL